MAVYNGEAYLRAQVESILAQLRPGDALIAVDDASTDGSAAILASFADPRLRVERHARNLGVLKTVERALELAEGEIVLLSDQDDLWLPGRLASVLEAFAAHPRATMVVSDATLIDAEGRVTSPSFFALRGRFSGNPLHNLVKNKCLGCTMAFRRAMLEIFLPIPPDVPMHDIWFGVLNGLYGSACYIDRPLVAYRRHGGNASTLTRAGLPRMAAWRLALLRNVAARVARRALRA